MEQESLKENKTWRIVDRFGGRRKEDLKQQMDLQDERGRKKESQTGDQRIRTNLWYRL